MANTAQAKKRARQAEAHRQHNASLRSMVRTYIKKVYGAIAANDRELAETSFKLAVPVIDRMANKGLLHKNKAARHKSRMASHLKKLASGIAPLVVAKKAAAKKAVAKKTKK